MKGTSIDWIIEKSEYHNEFGEIDNTKYYIYRTKRFLGLFYYKSYVKHKEGDMSGTYYVRTRFNTIDAARFFVKNTLCKGGLKSGHQKSDVETINCN